MALSEFDLCGEFTAIGAAMPVHRGDLIDVLIGIETWLGSFETVSRGVVLWAERSDDDQAPTCDLIDFDGGLPGLMVSVSDVIMSEVGSGVVALRAPHGIAVWIRLLLP